MSLNLTSVIPTKNRPDDLVKALISILEQTRLPDQLIIVDQSSDNKSASLVNTIISGECYLDLVYVHDPFISGLVEAKYVATELACGDIICFLEDDVILEPDYIEQIELGFLDRPDMVGCCGVITNPPRQSAAYVFFFKVFHRGIFMDRRVGLYGCFTGRGHKLIASEMLSGGLSAWRREVFKLVAFDVANCFHMYEDIDFSTRVARYFGPRLYVNPNARLEHHCSPVNREVHGPRQRRKLTECIVYYKKRRDGPRSLLALLWLLCGMLFEALFQSCLARSFGPLRGYCLGLYDGSTKKVILS